MAELTGSLLERQTLKGKPHIPIKGEDGGYYTPAVKQIDKNTVQISFAANKEDMPPVAPANITLPDVAEDMTTELWTFELDDGTTVTKQVVVK